MMGLKLPSRFLMRCFRYGDGCHQQQEEAEAAKDNANRGGLAALRLPGRRSQDAIQLRAGRARQAIIVER